MRIAPRRAPHAAPDAAVPLLAAAALLLACTGCSSGSGAGSKQLDALRHLPAAGNTSQAVTYIDEAKIRELTKADSKRYTQISSPAPFLQYSGMPWGDALTEDQIDATVEAGQTGHWDGRFDPAAVAKELKKHGFTSKKQDGMDVLTSDGSLKVAISDSELFYSTSDKDFSPSDPGKGDSLAGTKEYRQIADCLGDVYRADYNTLSTKEPVRLSAVGQHDESGKNSEVLCVVAEDEAAADKVAARVREAVDERKEKFAGAKVTTSGGDHPMVRVVVPDSASQKPDRLLISDVELMKAVYAD